jgi:serine/threonine protein kinase
MRLSGAEYKRMFVQLLSCDLVDSRLTMEYMENGTLRDYLRAHSQVDRWQRRRWILAMTDGLTMLHANEIIHCDFTPNNMLLDCDLELKIADFGCSSIDNSTATGVAGIRFCPCLDWKSPASTDEDLFALGSSMYEVLTGERPLEDVPSDQVSQLHRLYQFADLTGLELSDVIRDCWLGRAHSADAVHQRVLATVRAAQQGTAFNGKGT